MSQFLTQKEASDFLRISDETLKRYKQRRSLICGVHYFKREGIVRFDKEQLAQWLKGEPIKVASRIVDEILASI